MAIVFQKPSTLTDAPMHYCPGCTHGIVHRLVAQALEELGVEGKAVGVASVGCSVMCYDYFYLRYGAGPPRTRPGSGHRPQARPSR